LIADQPEPSAWKPRVSVIVPCYNEEATIQLLLEAIYHQTFPRQEIEVVIADGQSNDQTRQRVSDFQRSHPDLAVRLVENPQRTIPAALNRALRAAQGGIIVRLDAHSAPRSDYIARCVAAIEAGLGDNVGGVWEIHPGGSNWQARAIAAAAAHPLGVGDARYRYGETAQIVDTVPFGAYRRSLVDKIGLYDESLLTNEDYEFNVRVRQAGGKVWLDPSIRSVYFARPNFRQLARQYWRYGFWKARMLRRYPETIRWRQALPPAFVLSLIALPLFSIWSPLAAWVFMIESIIYALFLLFVGFHMGVKNRDWALIPGVPLAIATMHLAWGSAFLWSVLVS
jgi:glycosyltransferase involved in cell wall biosynthesis